MGVARPLMVSVCPFTLKVVLAAIDNWLMAALPPIEILVLPTVTLKTPFVGVVEIVCGPVLLIGLVTRLATVPLLIDISVAIYSTKIVTFAKNRFWGTMHEARTDVSMLLGLVVLLLVGAGAWSLDAWLAERRGATHG